MMKTLDFEKMNGLVPAVVQDADTKEVLMLGFMNQDAYKKTLSSGRVTFWSRTRQTLWTKGETSGNTLQVVSVYTDCDNDSVLVVARLGGDGVCCHTGERSCFYTSQKITAQQK